MDEKLKKLFVQLTDFWKTLSKRIKIILISSVAGIALVISLIVILCNTVSYSLLYSGLDATEAGQITDRLQQLNIPTKVKGTSIYVDAKQADTVKMKLAEEGYPQTTLTYDIFMKGTSWAMTDSDKQKLALYQVQDRLQNTIKTIPGVDSAQVTIGQQDQNSYVLSTDSVPVTASIKLNLKNGVSLTSQQVRGIVLLVSKSVPNLKEDNVAVLDSDGTPLTDSSNLSGGLSSDRLELQKKIETMVQSKVVSLLEPIFGSGSVRAAAGAVLDFSSSITSKTTYAPQSNGQGVPQTVDKTTQGTSVSGSGQTQYPAGTASQTTTGGSNTTEKTSYLVDTINQQIQDDGGKVSKLTVAVILDEKSPAAAAGTDALKQTIAFAVGIDQANVTIQLAPFQTAATKPTSASAFPTGLAAAAAAGILLVIGLVAGLVAILRKGRKKRKLLQVVNPAYAQAAAAKSPAAKSPASKSPAAKATADAQAPAQNQEIESILKDEGIQQAKEQVEQYVDKRPELVAQLIKSWLKDK